MRDMDRDQLLRDVNRRLADGRFARRLTATASDGSKPIVVAVASEPVSSLIHNVTSVGGVANVVASLLDGWLVFAMTVDNDEDTFEDAPLLDPDCTVAVLIARMAGDGGTTHVYRCPDSHHVGEAERAIASGGSLVEA